MCGDIEIEKRKFRYYLHPTNVKNVNIDKILISNTVSFGKKVLNNLLITRRNIILYDSSKNEWLCK